MAKKVKKPWLAAILNFVFPGLGYLYLGRRKIFAGMLIVIVILAGVDKYVMTPSVSRTYTVFGVIISLILSSAFAYDAYSEAKA